MDTYSTPSDIDSLKPNNIYKITTTKDTFLVKFLGRNKDNGFHFVLVSNGHTIVIQKKDIISLFNDKPSE